MKALLLLVLLNVGVVIEGLWDPYNGTSQTKYTLCPGRDVCLNGWVCEGGALSVVTPLTRKAEDDLIPVKAPVKCYKQVTMVELEPEPPPIPDDSIERAEDPAIEKCKGKELRADCGEGKICDRDVSGKYPLRCQEDRVEPIYRKSCNNLYNRYRRCGKPGQICDTGVKPGTLECLDLLEFYEKPCYGKNPGEVCTTDSGTVGSCKWNHERHKQFIMCVNYYDKKEPEVKPGAPLDKIRACAGKDLWAACGEGKFCARNETGHYPLVCRENDIVPIDPKNCSQKNMNLRCGNQPGHICVWQFRSNDPDNGYRCVNKQAEKERPCLGKNILDDCTNPEELLKKSWEGRTVGHCDWNGIEDDKEHQQFIMCWYAATSGR